MQTKILVPIAVLLAAGCATMPSGPSVMVLPGSGLSFEQFGNDDAVCRQHAQFQVGGVTPSQSATSSAATSAVVGTALGAAAGAALAGGKGAAIGAGTGLLAGSVVGASRADSAGYDAQSRFDTAYIQCMYAKGHKVPVSGQFSYQGTQPAAPAPSPATRIPPPPPGSPPPPPSQ